MSLKAINWMAKQTTGDDKMKSALFWLAFHLNDETGECFPSISTLQAEMEVKSDNTVRGALRRLREAGFISWERETKDGLTVKTNYHLHMNGSMAEGTSASNGTSTIAVPQPLREGTSTVEGGTSTIAGGVLQPVRTNREIEQGINRERNRESSMRTSGTSSAIAAVASAQAQMLPTSFPQSSNSQNHSETKTAGKDSLPNASERSVAAHRDRLDASDEQTIQNDAGCSQNASTRISGACPENEPPPMSDEDLENLFADAQLEECPPFPEKGVRPPFEKGVRLPEVSEKGDHLSTATKRRATPRRKTSTPCPFDMESSIPDEYLEIAQKAGIGDPQQVFSAFVNHALAHDRRLVIWPAGFRTWCSNELKWHPDQTPKPKPLHQRTAADYDW
nr:MAG TPA_asm: helix-turn-helix domain protein [Caudoviricetes sp.]